MQTRDARICLGVLFLVTLIVPAWVGAADQTPPVISHRPIKLARSGKPLNIIAHVADDSPISRSVVKIDVDGETVLGKLPPVKRPSVVPVRSRVTAPEAKVTQSTNQNATIVARVNRGAQYDVISMKKNHYMIHEPDGFRGYISRDDAEIILTGTRYGVALPGHMTSGKELKYQLIFRDRSGNTSRTEWTTVRLLTPADIMALRQGNLPESTSDGGSAVYKKSWFWAVLAATAGGAYYYTTLDDDSKDPGTVNLMVDWE